MKAMLLEQNGPIESFPLKLVNLPCPEPCDSEILIQVKACGVCRTDLHIIEGDLTPKQFPLVPGHQVVGVIEKLGPKASRYKIGTRVGVAWLGQTCGDCEFCQKGRENLCSGSLYTGYHKNGGYAEYICAHQDFVYEIPSAFSDATATPLLCAGIIGYRALVRSNLPAGGQLGIFGFGSSAHITIQVARSRGAQIFVATREAKHREHAIQLGAAWAGDTYNNIPSKLDSAIIFAPAGEIVPAALRALKPAGTVALAGIHMSNLPEMDYDSHIFHEKVLTSVEANTRQDGRDLLNIAAQIPIAPTVQIFKLEQANEALQKLKSDGLTGTAVLVL